MLSCFSEQWLNAKMSFFEVRKPKITTLIQWYRTNFLDFKHFTHQNVRKTCFQTYAKDICVKFHGWVSMQQKMPKLRLLLLFHGKIDKIWWDSCLRRVFLTFAKKIKSIHGWMNTIKYHVKNTKEVFFPFCTLKIMWISVFVLFLWPVHVCTWSYCIY